MKVFLKNDVGNFQDNLFFNFILMQKLFTFRKKIDKSLNPSQLRLILQNLKLFGQTITSNNFSIKTEVLESSKCCLN